MQLLYGKDQIPIFSPHDIAVINDKILEFGFIKIFVVLGVRVKNVKDSVSENCRIFASETIGKAVRLKFFSPIAFRA